MAGRSVGGKRPTSQDERGALVPSLPDPAVPAEAYDEDYYLKACSGSESWASSDGVEMAPMYPGALELAGLGRGDTLVDVGTGRGELLVAALQRGASRATGVEYSQTAVDLARRTIETHGLAQRASVLLADARAIPIDDSCADIVTFLDVVEHLSPEELDRSLREAFRLLKPGGRVFIHTLPNRTIYEVTYRLQRGLHPGRRRRWPADPRVEYERLMHVNEQTVRSLRRALSHADYERIDVRVGEWVHTGHVPDVRAKRLYHRLARHRLTERLGVANIWGEAVRPS